jgi:prepilin-type N-terminal cleavage/methylation domain-containing protein
MNTQSKSRIYSSFERSHRPAFTLTELLIVIGLIAMLISLLMPVLGKARAAANAATCLSNLRQLGAGWQMYTSENRGRLLEYQYSTPTTPDSAWNGYWLGALDTYKVRGGALLCPSAKEPIPYAQTNKGYGNVNFAWSGKWLGVGNVVRFNPAIYRVGSYGFNKYLTVGGKFSKDLKSTQITAVKPLYNVPVLFDSVFIDAYPSNYSPDSPPPAPPNLNGSNFPAGHPEHWKFLLARHGKGIDVYLADGSARWTPLEETYMLTWKADWISYPLTLPKN